MYSCKSWITIYIPQPYYGHDIGNFLFYTLFLKYSVKQFLCKLWPQEIGQTVERVIYYTHIGHSMPSPMHY